MSRTTKWTVVSLALFFGASAALAAVQVRFIAPERFIDAGEVERDRDRTMKLIETHLKQRGEAMLPGLDLAIEVTDIDLAGNVWPAGARAEMLRIAGPVGRPAMSLRYVLSREGQELRRGESRLSDLDYLHHINRYFDTDPIRYEKRMIDQWFYSEFSPVTAAGK
ncbi:DUF3016 domain-containing protein [Roseateles violae]|uniref:DUF3016 domain-containing protein n=1 Tax=Roseateles violae TaxID=3058042 RepID=A0ABT8DU88_9BURK|nr:DUF3016 domain-containing protein [Pelomonas sp. PFR6]MDN3921852.1 DUF3016 domain-containing protein [Pelomonas sp. PFR6]